MRDIELQEIADAQKPFQPEDLYVSIDDIAGDGLITIHVLDGPRKGSRVATMAAKDDEAVSYADLLAAAPLLYQAAEKAVAEGECTGPSDTHHCHLIMEDIAKWCGHCQLDHAIAAAKGATASSSN